MTRVFINGFGRIGRTVLRAWAQGAAPGIDIVGLNDLAAPETCAYLFEYDSIFGPYRGTVMLTDGALEIDGRKIPLHTTKNISTLDLSNVDVVMECTGHAKTRDFAAHGLTAGAKRVLISGPSDVADATIVLGANDATLGNQPIISNASCTTNALAPLVKLIDEHWGLKTGWMTTIHCYTSSQPTIDQPRAELSRSRAASLSMVPTTTSAHHLLDQVLPDLAGRVEAAAVRVPVASVSAVDLTVLVDADVTRDAVNAVFAAQSGIIGATDKPLVSTDLRARPESLVTALPETRLTKGGLLRVFGWYDNEWGFSHRMLDMAARMG